MKALELVRTLRDDYVNCFKLGYVNGENWKEIDEAILELEAHNYGDCKDCVYWTWDSEGSIDPNTLFGWCDHLGIQGAYFGCKNFEMCIKQQTEK